MVQVFLKLVIDGQGHIAEAGQDHRLDAALHILRLQVAQQDLHDAVAVGVDLILQGSTHITQHTHRNRANLPLLQTLHH